MKRVLIAGTTGCLGCYMCAEYQRRGWYVIALVPKTTKATSIAADQLVEAQAADPATLDGVMTGVDLVVSCFGIKQQADGLEYWNVDYQSNLNLLREAQRAGVDKFAHVHGLGARDIAQVPCALALDMVGECQGIRHLKDHFENSLAETPTASVHQLIPERKKS